jgi:hypothetical protein
MMRESAECATQADANSDKLIRKHGMPASKDTLRDMLSLAFCDGAAMALAESAQIVQDAFTKALERIP